MGYKLIACDLDETLLNDEHLVCLLYTSMCIRDSHYYYYH